jgi:TDG/mug DNA glycosylase family protein
MAYKAYLRYAEDEKAAPELGLQPWNIADSRVFVVPNPSPANARYSVEALTAWYDEVAAALLRQTS